jgi:hypothetical protein
MLNYFTANTIVELMCLVFAVICLMNDKNAVWRSMMFYLLVTCIAEFSGIYISSFKRNNHWVYNIFLICEIGFTNLMFFNLFNKYIKPNLVILIGMALLVVLYLMELYGHGFYTYNNSTYTVMSVMFVLYSLYYLSLLIKDDNYINLSRSAEFWWVVGTLFFYFANTVCNLFDDQLYAVMITPKHHLTYFIFKALNIILYSCWSYSFICRKWLTPTSKNLS